MRKQKLKTSVFAVASISLLLLSTTAFNAAAAAPEEHDEEVSNNLSVPAIFAEGYGITGLKVVDDESTGLPGEVGYPDWGTSVYYESKAYYLQPAYNSLDAINSTWMAEYTVANPPEKVEVTVDWSDSVINGEWNYKSVIPIGVTLYAYVSDTVPVEDRMDGYKMFELSDDGINELTDLDVDGDVEEFIYGTDKSTYKPNYATVYTVGARLTIKKFTECPEPDPEDEDPETECFEEEPVFDSAVYDGFGVHARPTWYLTTIDGPGKIVYFYNWNLAEEQCGKGLTNEGSYRLTFSIDDATDEYKIVRGPTILKEWGAVSSNVILLDTLHSSDAAGPNVPVYVSESEMYVDIEISPEMGD